MIMALALLQSVHQSTK